MLLPVPRHWREGTGDGVTGAECKHTQRTHTQSVNTDTQTSRGFVVLCGFVFPQAQQRLVCLNRRAKHMCRVAHAWFPLTHVLIKALIRRQLLCALSTAPLKLIHL